MILAPILPIFSWRSDEMILSDYHKQTQQGAAATLCWDTGYLVTHRLNKNEYQHDLCCSFHSLWLSPFLYPLYKHTACLCGRGHTGTIMWPDAEVQPWCVSYSTLDSNEMTLVWHSLYLSNMSIANPKFFLLVMFWCLTDSYRKSKQYNSVNLKSLIWYDFLQLHF